MERYAPLCKKLAQESGNGLPFHYLHMPLIWWDHFNNTDGTDFRKKRGTNFLGSQSRLQKLFLLVLNEGSDIVGTVPIVIYSIRIPGEKDTLQLITFPGDFFIAYQDFNVSPRLRKEAIKSFLDTMIKLLDDNGLIILPHVPENSPNIQDLRQCINDLSIKGFHCLTSRTGSSGGVRSWTMESIVSCLRQIADKTKDPSYQDEILKLMAELETCPPINLLFPKTRNSLEGKIRDIIQLINNDIELETSIKTLESILTDVPVLYYFIQLPNDREAYYKTLSKATWKHIRNMRNNFIKNGCSYEKLDPSRITEKDIDDYMRLHDLRWGDHSVSLINDTTYHFHKDLCRQLASEGSLSLFFAQYQGKRIATLSCIDIQGRREAVMTGRDPEYADMSAGFLLFFETIIDAIDHGFHSYDFGMGWYAYKTRFTKTYIHTLNFFISPETSPIYLTKLFLGYECMISS